MGAGLLSLPQDVHMQIFESLHASSERADATNLALTCSALLRAFRVSQSVILLPDSPVALAFALSNTLPALPDCTTSLGLSDRSLSPHAAVLWSHVPPLACVKTLCLPPAPRPPPSILPARRRVRGRGCLASIARCLPCVTSLSIPLSAPHDALLYLLLSVRPTPSSLLTRIKNVSVTASSSRHLCHDSQIIMPALLRATSQSLERFSITMPSAILPDDFVSTLVDLLGKAPRLQATSLALPSYTFLPGRPGYRHFPKLEVLLLGSVVLGSAVVEHENAARARSVLLEHLPLWKKLRSLVVLSIEKSTMASLFALLRDRVLSVAVSERRCCRNWNSELSSLSDAPAPKGLEGVDRDVAALAFSEWLCAQGYPLATPRPIFIADEASWQPRENCLVLTLLAPRKQY